MIDNLLPVTIGNIIGGSLLVAIAYWAIFLRRMESQEAPAQKKLVASPQLLGSLAERIEK